MSRLKQGPDRLPPHSDLPRHSEAAAVWGSLFGKDDLEAEIKPAVCAAPQKAESRPSPLAPGRKDSGL